LFHSLGVHAVGDSRWDSHVGMAGQYVTCNRSLDYTLDDFDAMSREGNINMIRSELKNYLSEFPFEGHCYGATTPRCDCDCHEADAPLGEVRLPPEACRSHHAAGGGGAAVGLQAARVLLHVAVSAGRLPRRHVCAGCA
jgi:hypothetical protein